MPRVDATGVTALKNGTYKVRIKQKINGKQINTSYVKDERTGEHFTRLSDAAAYRAWKIEELKKDINVNLLNTPITFSEMWDFYLEADSKSKAQSTVAKFKSVWKNHIEPAFADKYINGPHAVTTIDINNFLQEKLETTSYSYHYVEGFLKVFYCLYGNAYRRGYIDLETLNKYTVERQYRINMPPRISDDIEEVEIYDQYQIEQMYSVFKDTDLETAFLLAAFCGLRESEIFGLFWDDWDDEKRTLTIQRQLLRSPDGYWYISRCKTLAGKRVIELPPIVEDDLVKRYKAKNRRRGKMAYKMNAVEIVIDTTVRPAQEIRGGDFINRKLLNGKEGTLLTVNSLKYYSKKIKEEFGYSLKMHGLRKTHLSYLASHNYPIKALQERAGHKKIDTTMKYYIANDEETRTRIESTLNQLKPVAPWFYDKVNLEELYGDKKKGQFRYYKYKKGHEWETRIQITKEEYNARPR